MKATIENGPLPVAPDALLWRYVSLPALLLYLDRRLRLPSILSLQRLDRLEGMRPWDCVTQTEGYSQAERKEIWEYFESTLSQNAKEMFRLNRGSEANQRQVYDYWHRLVMSTRYGLSFFVAGHESIAMWRLYAPQGFAIRTSLHSLNKALVNSERTWRISHMKYWDKSARIGPDQTNADDQLKSTLRRPFLLKSREYAFENEVRLFTVDGHARPNLVVDNVAPEDWIEQIRVSPEVWTEDAELLQTLIGARVPALKSKIACSPLVSKSKSGESAWSDCLAEVSQESAENWPAFLHDP